MYSLIEGKWNYEKILNQSERNWQEKKEIQDIWNKQDYGEAKLAGDYINYKRTKVQIKWLSQPHEKTNQYKLFIRNRTKT